MATVEVIPGFRIEQVAAEPLVQPGCDGVRRAGPVVYRSNYFSPSTPFVFTSCTSPDEFQRFCAATGEDALELGIVVDEGDMAGAPFGGDRSITTGPSA